jgi:hypothetical protein
MREKKFFFKKETRGRRREKEGLKKEKNMGEGRRRESKGELYIFFKKNMGEGEGEG